MGTEPIFDAILQNMVLGNAVHLKKKARIKVKDSAVLIGICDETGFLQEGEVWISVNPSSFENDEYVEEVINKMGGKIKKAENRILMGSENEIVVEG
jgi:hypothetical protein